MLEQASLLIEVPSIRRKSLLAVRPVRNTLVD
jgi:hypothetical protein